MNAEQVILTRLLPKTGQEISYTTGDDGYYEAGWWKGKKVADNKTRFIAKTIDGDDVVIDRATGLVWAADGNAAGCNNGGTLKFILANAYAGALDFAGFTDWRIPNLLELISIVDYAASNPSIYTEFTNTASLDYNTSTTEAANTDNNLIVKFDDGLVNIVDKGYISSRLRCVRGGV